jgi:hypothetical protein
MHYNTVKVHELGMSYINGNVEYVKDKVKRLNKVEFVLLCSMIVSLKDNVDIDEIAFKLTS